MFSVCSSNACGIPTPNTYFLTGGLVWTGRWSRTSQVSSYSTTGWTQDLPDLTIERQLHACSFYTTDSGEDVLMVTGGLTTGNKRLDSTEVFRNNAWSVLASAALPSPTSSLSAGKIDDTIFLLGGKPTGRILRFNSTTERWEDDGRLQRHGFAMQVVDNAEKFCN